MLLLHKNQPSLEGIDSFESESGTGKANTNKTQTDQYETRVYVIYILGLAVMIPCIQNLQMFFKSTWEFCMPLEKLITNIPACLLKPDPYRTDARFQNILSYKDCSVGKASFTRAYLVYECSRLRIYR